MQFTLQIRGSKLRVDLQTDSITFEIAKGEALELKVRDEDVRIEPGELVTVALADQGPLLPSLEGSHPIVGSAREDGSLIRAVLPEAAED